jgi:hypothetical protein
VAKKTDLELFREKTTENYAYRQSAVKLTDFMTTLVCTAFQHTTLWVLTLAAETDAVGQ